MIHNALNLFFLLLIYQKELQALVLDPEVRSRAFDILVKTAIPVKITAQITVQYPGGVEAPDTDAMAAAIADAINNLAVGARRLNSTVIAQAIANVNAEYTVLAPIQMAAQVFMPDGRTAYNGSTHYIEAPEAEGITNRNTMFVAYPDDITVVAQEVVG